MASGASGATTSLAAEDSAAPAGVDGNGGVCHGVGAVRGRAGPGRGGFLAGCLELLAEFADLGGVSVVARGLRPSGASGPTVPGPAGDSRRNGTTESSAFAAAAFLARLGVGLILVGEFFGVKTKLEDPAGWICLCGVLLRS